ncbi:hypothetical protein [Halosimplex amylolyticum]|uniref:hypothetical protein n=1 Tax=Halosimplex amylolyticum TaxID=3396616 RepID=UPI003F551E3C
MTETDTRKVAFGLVLLAVSTVLIFGPGTLGAAVPFAAIAAGTLGLAAGALLVGTSSDGRPV